MTKQQMEKWTLKDWLYYYELRNCIKAGNMYNVQLMNDWAKVMYHANKLMEIVKRQEGK